MVDPLLPKSPRKIWLFPRRDPTILGACTSPKICATPHVISLVAYTLTLDFVFFHFIIFFPRKSTCSTPATSYFSTTRTSPRTLAPPSARFACGTKICLRPTWPSRINASCLTPLQARARVSLSPIRLIPSIAIHQPGATTSLERTGGKED